MVVVTVLGLHTGQLGVMFDNTIGGCFWQTVVVTVLGVRAGHPVLQTLSDIKGWLASFNEGDGVGHMLTVVGLFTVCVCLIVHKAVVLLS